MNDIITELSKIIPPHYLPWLLAAWALVQNLGRVYHAIESGGGLKSIWCGLVFGTNTPKQSPQNPPGASQKSGVVMGLALMLSAGFLFTGCASTPRIAYQATATGSLAVREAVKAYNVLAADGKTTPAQNLAVKKAYEKYQAAFAVLCDLGAVSTAAGATNAPTAALELATQNANQSVADLLQLLTAAGVTVK